MKENKVRTLNTKITESELKAFDMLATKLYTTRSKLLRSLVKSAIKSNEKALELDIEHERKNNQTG